MTARFGKEADFFINLFDALATSTPAIRDSHKVGAARNLFYVAVTRAKKNLCVVYLLEDQEDITNISAALTSIFEDVEISTTLSTRQGESS